ncbi:MAG: TspO/MBR family protein [Clostridiaceae bacterium]|nr:TspO/MBR family protein [Clostridiaceae bacterium]
MRWKALIVNLAIPLAVGGLAGLLTQSSMAAYADVIKPPGSPPGILFPIVWTILYLLMGISSYLVWTQPDSPAKRLALSLYAVSLAVNFLWPIVFFTAKAYLPAFVVLLALWGLVLAMIFAMHRVKPVAAWLQIPYLLWLTFAAYLNLGVFILN